MGNVGCSISEPREANCLDVPSSRCFTRLRRSERTDAKPLRLLAAIVLIALVGRCGSACAATLTNLHSFTGGTDGGQSLARLIEGSDGSFYGTTAWGGTKGWGTVFQMRSAGTFTPLHDFSGGADGGHSSFGGALVEGDDGSFYGTTYEGGTFNTGTVFKITSAGTLTTLHSFAGADGGGPEAGPVQGADGYFYGTTYGGGTNNLGTVYKVSSTGGFTNLYQFSGADGEYPYTGLVQGSDGNFYGTTFNGGTNGCGTAFQITSAGALKILHHFDCFTDGTNPYGPLVQGNDGYFYGTTSASGPGGGGTVFKISSAGTFTNLYQFSGGGGPNGLGPQCGLLQGSDGNFYGTTYYGGTTNSTYPSGAGVVFMISPTGTLTPVYQFSGQDGASPYASLVQGHDGNFYGTTSLGSTYTHGAIFQLSTFLSPPANQISAIQLDGTNVVVTIPSVWREVYQLQYCDSLADGNWSNSANSGSVTSIGGPLTLTNSVDAVRAQRFYRFLITP
jgi:uncharacterized repeat protein (TIGR03803 family)